MAEEDVGAMAQVKLCISGQHDCGWDPSQTYTCVRCEKQRCYCFGAADATPALCDSCAVFIQDLWAEPVSLVQPITRKLLRSDDDNDSGGFYL